MRTPALGACTSIVYDYNNRMSKPKARKPETKLLTNKEREALVKRYAKLHDYTLDEALNRLVASGWRRLAALARYGAK
jgi:hypothetical protein